MSAVITQTPVGAIQEFTANLAQAAATYDLCTANGDVLILRMGIYIATAGATFTSVSLQTNQSTPFTFLAASEGTVANLAAAQKSVPLSWNQVDPVALKNGQKIQYTIVGSTGTGSLKVALSYLPVTAGAFLQ